jgi:hypothetical protein
MIIVRTRPWESAGPLEFVNRLILACNGSRSGRLIARGKAIKVFRASFICC